MINGTTNVQHSSQKQGTDGKYTSTVDYTIPRVTEYESFSGETELYTFKVNATDVNGPGQVSTYVFNTWFINQSW